jgi:hypothetical protein
LPQPSEGNGGQQYAAENDQDDAEAAEADRDQGARRTVGGGVIGNEGSDEHARDHAYAADGGQAHGQAGSP